MLLLNGDCIEQMQKLIDEGVQVESVVTDPPYELGFMGKSWDASGIAFDKKTWELAFQLLKPGGYLLAFSASRNYHRMAVAVEDAGFEIRDQIMWIYGSGFPKSLNLGDGWGTALKPAHEPIVMARKFIEGTNKNNREKYGTGGINIDGCRVGKEILEEQITGRSNKIGTFERKDMITPKREGRFPANVMHDGSDVVQDIFPNSKGSSGNGNAKLVKQVRVLYH
jgi:DNA modification methylase